MPPLYRSRAEASSFVPQQPPRDCATGFSASALAFAEETGKSTQAAEEFVTGEGAIEDPPRTRGRTYEGFHHIAVAGGWRSERCEVVADLFAQLFQLHLEPLLPPVHLFERDECAHGL